MRIAIIAPTVIAVPPLKYGGMERIVDWTAKELVSRGHEVFLFAHDESKPTEGVTLFPWVHRVEGMAYAVSCHNQIIKLGIDIVHDFTHDKWLSKISNNLYHVVSNLQALKLDGRNPEFISYAQRNHLTGPKNAPVDYQGVPEDAVQYQDAPTGDYLLVMASVHDYKGTDIAIDLAEKLGHPLKIAGLCWETDWWNAEIQPRLDKAKYTEFVGEVGGEEKMDLLKNAKALIHPVRWCEAGGIIVEEALGCGVPVIGTSNGVMPEYIKHEENGLLFTAIGFNEWRRQGQPANCYIKEDAEKCINDIGKIKRVDCRASYENFMTIKHAVDRYELAYDRVMTGPEW